MNKYWLGNASQEKNSRRSFRNNIDIPNLKATASKEKFNTVNENKRSDQMKSYNTVELKASPKPYQTINKSEKVNHFKISKKSKDNDNLLDLLIEIKNKTEVSNDFL